MILNPSIGQSVYTERATHHASEARKHLIALAEYAENILAVPPHNARQTRYMVTHIERWQSALARLAEMQREFEDGPLFDPDEGFDEEPEPHDYHVYCWLDEQMRQEAKPGQQELFI